jgi:hypothetical protein
VAAALREIVRSLQGWIGDQNFTEPKPPGCRSRDLMNDWTVERNLKESYVLSDSRDRPAGLLRVDALPQERHERRTWHVFSCRREELFGGKIAEGHGCDAVLLPTDSTTFQWPGIERPVNVALLRFQDTSATSTDVLDVSVLDGASDISLRAHAASACEE